VKNGVEANITGKIQYAFRRPRFPMICAVGNELLSVTSSAAFQRHIERLDLQGAKVIDIVDATGEGWALHADLMIVSPLTLKKRWKKVEVIRLFNESDNARRIGVAYPEAYIPRRSLVRIIEEVAALAAYAKPNKPFQRPGASKTRAPAAERQR
jgi:hypothetical protein